MKVLKASAMGLRVFIILIGCQEDHAVRPPIELLTSKVWKLEAYGTDLNTNNDLDVEEDVIVECQKDNTYAFFQVERGITLTISPFVEMKLKASSIGNICMITRV